MEILDNKDHILGEISKAAKREIAKLKAEHDAKVKTLKQEHKSRLQNQLKELQEHNERTLEKLNRQHASGLDLLATQRTLAAQSTVYNAVLEQLPSTLKGSDLNSIVALMVERISATGRDVREIHVYSEANIPNTIADLDEIKAIGVISDNEELEVTLQDLLKEHHVMVHDIIAAELFK